ncbi:hypothetical protein BJY00DRAFT_313668 [Aspergillus carlsbadensis]|nr:hypothetical protein BJY00DRAFT_313668 [Aspergillus carlsbadensis]
MPALTVSRYAANMASSTGRTLLGLPTEILVLIFYQTSTIRDACALSRTCSTLHSLLSRDKDKIDLLRTVADIPRCPKFDPGEAPVLVRPSSTTWAFPSSINPERGLSVQSYHFEYSDREIKTGFFDLAGHVKRLTADEVYWNAVFDFLIQFVHLKHHLPGHFANDTEELLALAASAQMVAIHDPNVEVPSLSDLRHESTIIALALQFLAIAHDFSDFEDRSADSTEEEICARENAPKRDGHTFIREALLPSPNRVGPLYPITIIGQQSEQGWAETRQHHGKRPGYALDADPGAMLEYIVQTAFRLLDTRDPRHEPTVLNIILILCVALAELDVTAPWLESVPCASGPLYALVEDLGRYYFICTNGAPIMSDRWDAEECVDRVGSDHEAAQNAQLLHDHWVKIDKGRWAQREPEGDPVDDFFSKLEYFAYNHTTRPLKTGGLIWIP